MVHISILATAAIFGSANAATQSLYGQCGGSGYTGPSTCTAGSYCSTQNAYYAQCTPGTGGATSAAAGTTTTTPKPATSTVKASSSTAKASSSAAPVSGGTTYKASFTEYGAGDSFGSPNCNTDTAACGFYDNPGYNAALSQNLFGVGPGAGAGPACGLCYQLTPQTDSSGNALSGAHTIIVKVNNLCPASGNPLCAQNGLSGTNQYGANVNFDLCEDDGAAAALFGSSGVGLALGTATQVSCSLYSGTQQ